MAVEGDFHLAVADAVDGDAVGEFVKPCLINFAEDADAVAANPAGGGEFEMARKFTVVGEEEEAFGAEVKAANGDDAAEFFRELLEDGWAAFGVAGSGDEAVGLMVTPEAGGGFVLNAEAVNGDKIFVGDGEGGCIKFLTVNGDAALFDHAFGITTRADARARHAFGDAFFFLPFRGRFWSGNGGFFAVFLGHESGYSTLDWRIHQL